MPEDQLNLGEVDSLKKFVNPNKINMVREAADNFSEFTGWDVARVGGMLTHMTPNIDFKNPNLAQHTRLFDSQLF